MGEATDVNGANAPKPDFSSEEMERLFYWARDRVYAEITGAPVPSVSALGELGERAVLGAFVSFKKRGMLRSCMGYMYDGVLLSTALDSASVSAATRDPRFPPISAAEFYDLDMEVWALGSMREIQERGEARRDAIKIGRDGIQIHGRGRRGLLLPSVALEMNWDADRFLEGVCDKAGLARGSWKSDDTRLFAFEGVSFKKPFVWNVSKNPSLAALIDKIRNGEEMGASSSRPTFSLASSLFQWDAPARKPAPQDDAQKVRPAAVAGAFYPGSATEQESMLRAFDASIRAESGDVPERKTVNGALVPHAGWIYSGRLAASTLSRIEPPETVVVLAPKHRREGANLAVMPYGAWNYGAGKIDADLEFADAFVRALPEFKKDAAAHRSEHSIEVQLPLIARYFPGSKVVGVLIGGATKTELKGLAERFAAFLDEWESAGHTKPLLLVSSDMNHYATDAATREIDKLATDAIETTEPDALFDTVMRNGITMCGVLPAFFALSALKKRGEFNRAAKVGYATSGDASGDLERVVGYAGYLFD